MSKLKMDDPEIVRHYTRTIGESEIEFLSLRVETISVECLTWVIRSIKADLMTPTEKLVLSRIKESFDLKVNSKLWLQVLKYFQSNLYTHDIMERQISLQNHHGSKN